MLKPRWWAWLVIVVLVGAVLGTPTEAVPPPGDDPMLKVALPLRNRLDTEPQRFRSIMIRLQPGFRPNVTRFLWDARTESPEDRRRIVVDRLKAEALGSQSAAMLILRRLESRGLVRDTRPLWILNVIGARATSDGIREIAALDDVVRISRDLPGRPVATATPSWSVTRIGADQVGGLDGSGIVVAVIDSGVDDTHPDLAGRIWENQGEVGGNDDFDDDGNGYVDDKHGWAFDRNSNEIDDDGDGLIDEETEGILNCDGSGHGTLVAGVVVGTGAGTGSRTGVAPDAKIIPLRILWELGAASEVQAFSALQYAVEKQADVANFSLAWRPVGDDNLFCNLWEPDCSEPNYLEWRESTESATDLGLFIVAASGNRDDIGPPENVAVPARAPRVLAVGATACFPDTATCSEDRIWVGIEEASSQGPSTWQDVCDPAEYDAALGEDDPCEKYDDYVYEPGLLKPDVVAPGVGVQTTSRQCRETDCACDTPADVFPRFASGTSLAAPHAAGVAALLLEQEHNRGGTLLPHELMYTLRETAARTGPPYTVYGYGRIDAMKAVQLDFPRAGDYDLSITGTNEIWTTDDIWVDNNLDTDHDIPVANQVNLLHARVRNVAERAVGNVEVKFYYADVGTIGISGFDPDGDGDPGDGNFEYIDSYFVPVIGPARWTHPIFGPDTGSSQDEALAIVPWTVPVPVTDHWCVGVAVIAPEIPNGPETNRVNNLAFRNFFEIDLTYEETHAISFYAYSDPKQPGKPFDFEFDRRRVPPAFKIKLAVPQPAAKKWFKRTEVSGGASPRNSRKLWGTRCDSSQRRAACCAGSRYPTVIGSWCGS